VSTAGLLASLRTRLLTFERLEGESLADILGTTENGAGIDGKLYLVQAPDNITKPENSPSRWGVMRIKNRRTGGTEQSARDLIELEVMLFARPRSQQAAMEEAADACDEAMLRYQNLDADLVGNWGRLRNTLPVMTEPADREVVQIRLMYTLVVYPDHLTQYHSTA
jgi:hypothetical protein